MTTITAYPEMMIGVIDGITALVKAGQDEAISIINAQHRARVPPAILTPYRKFFYSEKYEGYTAPVLYVLGGKTLMNAGAQQFLDQTHEVHCISLVEDRDEETLTRLCYLYPVLLHALLNQQSVVAPTTGGVFTLRLTDVEYAPIISMTSPDRRVFRKDATALFAVEHQESWSTP